MPFDCGAWLAKYLLCLFNFLVFLAGSTVLGVGIWLAVDKNSLIAITKVVAESQIEKFAQPAVIEQASYVLIAVGAFMFLVSFLGYCGAIRESQCLLGAYGICLVVFLLMEVTAGGLAAAYKSKAENETRQFLKSTIRRYYAGSVNETDAVMLMWDQLMVQMSCCGVDDYRDFEDSPRWKIGANNRTVPEACCVMASPESSQFSRFILKDPSCPYTPSEANSFYKQGCYKTLLNWTMEHINIVIAVAIGLGLIQLLGMFLAFCLCKSVDGYVK